MILLVLTSLVSWISAIVLGAIAGLRYAMYRAERDGRLCGHDWERFQIEGAHYRDPAALPFRMCKRCSDTELIAETPPVAVPTWDPFDSLGPCPSRRPPPTEGTN